MSNESQVLKVTAAAHDGRLATSSVALLNPAGNAIYQSAKVHLCGDVWHYFTAGAPVDYTDGDPAATEVSLGAGCVRSVAIDVPATGDLALTPAFRRFAEQLAGPCVPGRAWMPVSDSVLSAVLPASIQPDSIVRPPARDESRSDSSIAAWMLAAAMAAALVELLIRRGAANATA